MSDQEEMVEVPVQWNKSTMDKLNKMTKAQLIERICSVAVEAETYRLRCLTAVEDADRANREIKKLRTKLDLAESYVEQGRAMIEAVMERWHEYDT